MYSLMWTEHNLVHCRRKTSQTHTHSCALQPFRLVGPPQFKPILFYSSFQNTTFTDFMPVKLKVCSHICHIQYPTWNAGLQQISSLFSICEFFNVEKCKDIKYFLSLIFQDILGTSCNIKSQFISLNSYSNTDWTFNMSLLDVHTF